MFTRFTTGLALGLTLLASVALTGCGNAPGSGSGSAPGGDAQGRVAVVDLDRVAQAMGWSDELQRQVTSKGQELDVKFKALRDDMRATFEAEQKKIGEKPTDEEKIKLNQMGMELNRRLGEAQNVMQNELRQVQMASVKKYRDLIEPAARQVATQRGFSVVILPLDNILWSDAGNNLTDGVIDALRKAPPSTASTTGTPATPGSPETTPATPPAP